MHLRGIQDSLFQDIAEFEPVTWNEYIQSVDSLESLGIVSVDREAALLQPVTVTLRIREDMPQMQLAPAPVIWWWMHPAYSAQSAFLVYSPGLFELLQGFFELDKKLFLKASWGILVEHI